MWIGQVHLSGRAKFTGNIKAWLKLRNDSYYNMTVWRQNCGGCPAYRMCKATTQASSSRARHNADRVPAATFRQYRYGSTWLCLNSQLILPTTNPCMFMVIGDSITMVLIATSHSSTINWPFRFTWLVTVPRDLRPFTTGCVKLQIPSLRRDLWRHNGGQ